MAELGLPWPAFFAAMTIAVQLIGGLAVVSGVGAALGAALLAGFAILATLVGHPFWLLRGEMAHRGFTTSLEHLAIIGGLILVVLNELPEV